MPTEATATAASVGASSEAIWAVRARAPGKIILAGEHAVVHGASAVAAAIDLYTRVAVQLLPSADGDGRGSVDVDLKDVGLALSWSCEMIDAAVGSAEPAPSSPSPCSPERSAAVARLLEGCEIPSENTYVASGLSAFLFLYTSIIGYGPAKVEIDSDLPLGAGLGSSAAFCVALSGALVALSGAVRVEDAQLEEEWMVMGKSELELVNRWAFEGEKIIHGKPSGLDNTVSTYGSMIKFKKGEMARIQSSIPLKMLITDTKVGRNTRALVAGVSSRSSRHPCSMESVFHAVESISEELATVVESPAGDEVAVIAKEETIAELMEMNQGLLQCMGVGHHSIETVIRTTARYKITSKLTGAGGGGCVLSLIPSDLAAATLDKAISDLESCGFRCFTAVVGGKGLQISFS